MSSWPARLRKNCSSAVSARPSRPSTSPTPSPRLQLYRGSQLLRENTSWSAGTDAALIAAAAVRVGAFALSDGSKDCALLLYLPSGSYTAQISGVANTTGVALVEVYEVP